MKQIDGSNFIELSRTAIFKKGGRGKEGGRQRRREEKQTNGESKTISRLCF